jgi:hypothetical protein
VSWMVRQNGIKNPDAWIAFDMARVEASSASVGPEAPPKVALPVAVRQNTVEFEPVRLGTDLAKTSGASPLASKAALVSVEPETPLKVALPVVLRQNPVELEPVKLATDSAKTSGASAP